MAYLLNAAWRVTTHVHQYVKWFCYDKPNRIERGYGPDGLYPHERSVADKERLPSSHPEHREPAEPIPCAREAEHCDCERMLKDPSRRGGCSV